MSEKKAAGLLLMAAAMWGSSFVASKYCINSGMLCTDDRLCRYEF